MYLIVKTIKIFKILIFDNLTHGLNHGLDQKNTIPTVLTVSDLQYISLLSSSMKKILETIINK